MDLRQRLPTIHEGVIFKEVPQKSIGRSKRKVVRGTMAKSKRAVSLSVMKRNFKSYSLTTIVENTKLDAEMEKRGIFSPDKIVTSVSSGNQVDLKEKNPTTATKSTPQKTNGGKNSQLAQSKTIQCEKAKSKKNKKSADFHDKTESAGNKEGFKAIAENERERNLEFLASVHHGKLTVEEYREQIREICQDAMKRYSEVKTGKERYQLTTEMAEQKAEQKVVKCEFIGGDFEDRSSRKDNLPDDKGKKAGGVNALDQYEQNGKKKEKTKGCQAGYLYKPEQNPKEEVVSENHTKKVVKIGHLGGVGKEISQRKVKSAEEMEVKALDVWSAVHDKKDKIQHKENTTKPINNSGVMIALEKEELCEQNIQKSVEYKEKEKRPRRKLLLLEEILKEATEFESTDYNKNPIPGRKERKNHSVISQQIAENKSDGKMQKTPARPGHVTIPFKTVEENQMYNAPVIKTELRRQVVSPNTLVRDKKSHGQPAAHGPVNSRARPIDSPYVADIRQRGLKDLRPSEKILAPALPSKQSKSHCNLPEIYGSKKQSKSDMSIFPALHRTPTCSAKQFGAPNKLGSTRASRCLLSSIPPEATTDRVASKTAKSNLSATKTLSPLVKNPQSPEEIRNCLQAPNLPAKSKVSVDSSKDVLEISKKKSEKTVSINCGIEKRADNHRPVRRNGNTNTNANLQKFSAYKTVISKGSQAPRGSRRHGT